jgi:hypothetical protein
MIKSGCYIHNHFTSPLWSQWLLDVPWLFQFCKSTSSSHFVFTYILDVLDGLVWSLFFVCLFLNLLHNFVTCCTFGMSSPYTLVSCGGEFLLGKQVLLVHSRAHYSLEASSSGIWLWFTAHKNRDLKCMMAHSPIHSMFAGTSTRCCCHCTSTYPLHGIWLTIVTFALITHYNCFRLGNLTYLTCLIWDIIEDRLCEWRNAMLQRSCSF